MSDTSFMDWVAFFSYNPGGLLSGGGASGAADFSGGKDTTKKPKDPNAPAVPSMDTAAETANKEQTDARRALLLSGGETSLTGPGGAPILGGMTSSKTLLGV
jgi:hypothetical protein